MLGYIIFSIIVFIQAIYIYRQSQELKEWREKWKKLS